MARCAHGDWCQAGEADIPSVFEVAHNNSIEIENTFQQGIGGTIKIVGPNEDWQIIPDKIDFKLAVGEKAKRPFQVQLPFDVTSGTTPIRIDFDLTAEKAVSLQRLSRRQRGRRRH